jgi:hypothetical protein
MTLASVEDYEPLVPQAENYTYITGHSEVRRP